MQDDDSSSSSSSARGVARGALLERCFFPPPILFWFIAQVFVFLFVMLLVKVEGMIIWWRWRRCGGRWRACVSEMRALNENKFKSSQL